MRWPRDLSKVYVNGATIRYSVDQSVHYANEVLSPGQIICTWSSTTDYLSSGSAPTLPLLKINKAYELGITLKSDNSLPVQLEIDFRDVNQELITSYRSTEDRLVFTVPKGTIFYEVHLINLKHHWINFETLMISEIGVLERIISKTFNTHYSWVYTCPIRGSNHKSIRLIINKGTKSILPVSVHESINYEQIFIYTDGQDISKLIDSLSQTLRFKQDVQFIFEAGLGYYYLPSEFVLKLEEGLKQKILGEINNDKLDY
jgi:accessory Sec system protein Asp3